MNTNTLTKKEKTVYDREKYRFDRVYDVYGFRDFVEIKGERGGDLYALRFYDNGMVTER